MVVRVNDVKGPLMAQSGVGESAASFVTAKVPRTASRFKAAI
jgi:hypothetical protein